MALVALNKNLLSTSALIARSVNTNPVVIRRLIARLKAKGLLNVRAGAGGAALSFAPGEITLLDVYNAVKTSEDAVLFGIHKTPNPRCYVGRNILEALDGPLRDAQNALERRLASYTLLDIIRPIAEKSNIPFETFGDLL
jgi:DNA-binding IscR family transcriptional regulator